MKLITKIRFSLPLILIGISNILFGQDTLSKKKIKDIMQFNGYLKDLQVTNFSSLDSMSTFNLIHNRLNFKFYPCKNITGALEIRNRIYYGEQIQNTPGFGKFIDSDNGFYKLSTLLVNEKSLIIHTMIDRLWFDWAYKKWEIRAGRQRINWGKTLIWNPNDLFNTYNFADFDYEEQPGSDALKLTYYPSGMSAVELAVKPSRKKDGTVAAGSWRFNKLNYDFQLLGGLYYTDIALGAGWAGNVKDAGFKGEATWFQPKENLTDTTGILSATVSMDYSFKKPVYINGGVLYTKHHQKNNTNLFSIEQAFSGTLTAKNLMPTDWSFFAQVSDNITPLLSAELSVIYGLDPDFIFTMPSLTYSLSDNWDITLLEQGVYDIKNNASKPFNSIYIRMKWNF